MVSYVIHIGLPKTGTKYLQTQFRRRSAELLEQGIYYPSEWWSSDTDVNHDALLQRLCNPHEFSLEETFHQFARSASRKILLSCEGFSMADASVLERLRTLIGNSPIEIILYCRRWSDWLLSAWQQNVKEGSTDTLPEYLANTLLHTERVRAINLATILDEFERIFGRGALRIISYSNLMDRGLDIADSFFHSVLGLPAIPSKSREIIHESQGMYAAELVRCLNALKGVELHAGGIDTFRSFERYSRRRDVAMIIGKITDVMRDFIGEFSLDESQGQLGGLMSKLMRDYGDLVLDVGVGKTLFEPRPAKMKFIRQDYALRPNVSRLINQFQDTVAQLANAESVGQDPAHVRVRRIAADGLPDLLVAQGEQALDYVNAHPTILPRTPAANVCIDVNFGPQNRDNAAVLFGTGWSGPEREFRWNNGQLSILRLERPVHPADYHLLLVVQPFLAPPRLTLQRVSISVNGRRVGSAEIGGFAVLECDLPWTLLADTDSVCIEIALPDAAQPRSLVDSRDDRELALCFRRMVLFALPEPAPSGTIPAQTSAPLDHKAAPGGGLASSRDLTLRFESLGENCEFGLVQRRCGAEPLGLFRFSSTLLPALVRMLRSRFNGIESPECLIVETPANGQEYMIHQRCFDFRYHSGVRVGEQSTSDVIDREQRRLAFLSRKLIGDLAEASKIFVYHGMTPLAERQAIELAEAMHQYGPNTLLWVELADDRHPPGSVVRVAPGLLKGHIDRFAPGEDAHNLSLESWIELCSNVCHHLEEVPRLVAA